MKLLLVLVLIVTSYATWGQSKMPLTYNNFENSSEAIKKAGISKEFVYGYIQKKDKTLDSAVISIVTYDSSGLALSLQKVLSATEESKTVFFYNESYRLIKIVTTYPKSSSNSTQEFHYDSLGNEIFTSSYSSYHRNMGWKEYDEQGRLIKISTKINYDKKYVNQKIYYENGGALIRTEGLYPNGAKAYTESDEYSKDWLIKKTYLKNDGPKMLRYVYYYNEQYQLIRKEYFNEDVTKNREFHYKYNTDGTIAESMTLSNGNVGQMVRHYYYLFD